MTTRALITQTQADFEPIVALVKAGIEFPNGQAEMLEPDPAPEHLFLPTPWIPATNDVPIHNI